MQVKMKFVSLNKELLGDSDVFALIGVEQYKKFDQNTGKVTDEIEGNKYIILLNIPEKEINWEKLEVKIAGKNQIPQYKSGETRDCKFTNLKLNISKVEFGKATIRGVADSIELVSTKDNEQIEGQLKLNLTNKQ